MHYEVFRPDLRLRQADNPRSEVQTQAMGISLFRSCKVNTASDYSHKIR